MKSFSIARLLAVGGLFLALIAAGSGLGSAQAASLSAATSVASSIQISPAKQTQYVQGGKTYVFYYKLYNSNIAAASQPVKIVATSDSGWTVVVSPAETTVPAGTSVEFKVAVTVPQIATSNRSLVTINVFAADGSSTSAYLDLELGAAPLPGPAPRPTPVTGLGR